MPGIAQTIGVTHWEIPASVWEQLRLAHSLRNDLVTLQHKHDAALKELWAAFPAVRRAEAEIADLQRRADEIEDQIRAERSRRRRKQIINPLCDEQDAVHAQLKTLRAQRNAAITKAHKRAKPALDIILEELSVGYRRLYDRYTRRGLYWGTHNFVVETHKNAVQRVASQWEAGRSAELHHRRFDGGTLRVQLKREAGEPPRTPAVVADPHGRYRNSVHVPWTDPQQWAALTRAQQRDAGRGAVRMLCGSGAGEDRWVKIPVQQHRMLPADADITHVTLTVTRTANTWRARLGIIAKLPDPVPVPLDQGPAVALHMGWRKHDHGIQVATWRTTAPLDIPNTWQHVMRHHDGQTGVVVLPQHIADGVERAAALASQRDTARTQIQAMLVQWLEEHGPIPRPASTEDEELIAADVASWRSRARLAAIATAWRDTPPPDGTEIAAELESWRRMDRALWERQAHGRRWHLRRRNDLWHNVAAIIARQASHVVLDDMPIAQLAQIDNPGLSSEMQHQIQRRRSTASPARLRETIRRACLREGVTVTTVPAAGLSRTHADCGHQNVNGEYRSRMVWCAGCENTYNPDDSATILMLKRANAAG